MSIGHSVFRSTVPARDVSRSAALRLRVGWFARPVLVALGVLLQVRPADAAPVVFPETPLPGKAAFAESAGSRVRAILVHNNTIYVGGNFSVSQNGVTRTNLVALDLDGNLRPEFSGNPNGIVWALATDGKSLFVGGEYTRFGLKKRLAAVDLTTGAINPRFTAHVEGNLHKPAEEESQLATGVRSLAMMVDSSAAPPIVRLLVGGNFSQVNSTVDNRAGIAALDPETGDLDPSRFTLGVVDGYVNAVLSTPAQVYVGGTFNSFQEKPAGFSGGSSSGYSLGALDLNGKYRSYFTTGTESVTYARETPESVPKTQSEPLPIIDLDFAPASNRLFAAIGGKAGGANCAAAYDAPTGVRARGAQAQAWKTIYVGGDVQSVHYFGGNLYFGFHDGLFDQPDTSKVAVVDATTGLGVTDMAHVGASCDMKDKTTAENCWLPLMDAAKSSQQGFFGVWETRDFIDPVTGLARLIVGGEFTQVGGVANTKRLAIFAEAPPPLADAGTDAPADAEAVVIPDAGTASSADAGTAVGGSIATP